MGRPKKELMPVNERPDNSAVTNFFEAAGDDEMIKALQFAMKDNLRNLAGALLDPSVKTTFLQKCNKYDVSLVELAECFQHYQMSKGVIRMMTHVPQVMEDVAIDAKSQIVFCQKCDGKGVIQEAQAAKVEGEVVGYEDRKCPQCKGKGEVRIPGDKDARNLVFEASNLKGKQQAKVQIQQNFGAPSHEQAVNMVQKILVP